MEQLEKEIKKQKDSKKTILIFAMTAFAISIFTAFFLMLSIKGGKFEHSVGFSVIFKDRTEATVGPQLIY